MLWAKLYVDILGDSKLMRAARKGAKGLHLTPWFIVFAKEADDNGRLTVGGEPADPVDLAALIPNTTARGVSESWSSLKRIGVLVVDEDGALRFAAWEKRAGKPSDSPARILERVQKHRAATRERETRETENGVTPYVTPSVTPAVTAERNAPEQEKEQEQDKSEKVLARGKREPPKAKAVWLPQFQAAWRQRFQGELPKDRSVRALRRLCEPPNDPGEVLRRWCIYLDAHEHQGQYASAEKFASTYGQWAQAPLAKASPNGAHRSTIAPATTRLEALEVLSKLKGAVTSDGRARFVPADVIQSLNPAGQRALKAIGGGQRVANTSTDQWGFLENTFVQAYIGAQEGGQNGA